MFVKEASGSKNRRALHTPAGTATTHHIFHFGPLAKLEIFGLDGIARIVHADIDKGSGIDVSSLSKGFYVAKAVTNDGTHIKKVLKRQEPAIPRLRGEAGIRPGACLPAFSGEESLQEE